MAGFLKQFCRDLRADYTLNDRRDSFLFWYLKREREEGRRSQKDDSYSRLQNAFAAAGSEEGRRIYFLEALGLLEKSRKPLLSDEEGRKGCKALLLAYALGTGDPGLSCAKRWNRKVCKGLLELLERDAGIPAPDIELLYTLHGELTDALLLQEAEDYLYNLESGRKNNRDMAILEAYLDTHYDVPASGEASGPGAGLRFYYKKSASGGGGRVWDDERIAQLERFYQTLREGEYGEALIPICIDPRTGAGLFFLGKEYLWETGFDSRGICCIACLSVQALDLIVGSRPILLGQAEEEERSEKVEKHSEKDEKNTEKDEKHSDKGNKSGEGKAKEAVKAGILDILKKTYDIEEEDFISAELEIVPAGKAREAGFDRSMILAYGQDDRVCAFTSMRAMLDIKETERCVCCILVDKEEIGSVGATGMQSRFFENAVAELMNLAGEYSELNVRRCLAHSCMLSSDVSAGYDPSYASCFEKKNAAFMGCGMVFNKFTGSRGKSGSNDANAEYIAHLRKVLDDKKIVYQTAELGKVDVGGGGTIAYILALYGMNVIDCGVAVLNMHAPWEAVSKADVYETYRGYKAFAEGADL